MNVIKIYQTLEKYNLYDDIISEIFSFCSDIEICVKQQNIIDKYGISLVTFCISNTEGDFIDL